MFASVLMSFRLVSTPPPYPLDCLLTPSKPTFPPPSTSLAFRPGSAPTQPGAPRPGNRHRPNQQIRAADRIHYIVPVTEERGRVGRHHIIKIPQAIEIHIHDPNGRSQARRNFRRVGAHQAAT